MKPNWLYYFLVLLVIEKIVQHTFVTLAFYFNWSGIASTVAVSPALLMYSGAILAILFCVALWGLIRKQAWTVNLIMALALIDVIGEFVAQGRLDITINVSFIVALLLLVFSLAKVLNLRRAEI